MTTDDAIAAKKDLKTGFAKWQHGINQAQDDAKWSYWDCEIQRTVDAYNSHLNATPGYPSLNWKIIKAMVWVETGASHVEWHSRPMQIGVPGDQGLAAFLSGKEGGELIIPSKWKLLLHSSAVRERPEYNIRAGVGYLLMRIANFSHQSTLVADNQIFEVTVKPGDNLAKIARQQGSTIDTMLALNPQVNPALLRPGQVLNCRKASVKRTITGWRTINAETIARRYNGGGDPNYAKKLKYALEIIEKGKDMLCQ